MARRWDGGRAAQAHAMTRVRAQWGQVLRKCSVEREVAGDGGGNEKSGLQSYVLWSDPWWSGSQVTLAGGWGKHTRRLLAPRWPCPFTIRASLFIDIKYIHNLKIKIMLWCSQRSHLKLELAALMRISGETRHLTHQF